MAVERPACAEDHFAEQGSAWYGLTGAFALGVMAVISQAILLREGISAAAGHELMFGIVLTGWLTGQAICLSLAWGWSRWLDPVWAALLAGFSAPLSLVIMRLAVSTATPPTGTLPRLTVVAPIVILACLPASLGIALALASVYHTVRREIGGQALPAVYAAETLGFLVGGISWTFLLAGYISHIQVLLCAPGSVLLFGLPLVFNRRRWPLYPAIALVLLAAGWFLAPPVAALIQPELPEGLNQVACLDGQRARWQVAEYGGESCFYRNGRLLMTTGQPELAAQSALLPLAQALPTMDAATNPNREINVLHIGMRPPGVEEYFTSAEGVTVTWLDGDDDYLDLLAEATGTIPTPAAHQSPAALLANRGSWDLVVLAVGPPSSPHSAWAYDPSFLCLVKDGLSDHGVIALSLDAESNYNAAVLHLVHERIHAALSTTFATVLATPPSPVWYFAGNPGAALTLDPAEIESRLASRGVYESWLSRWVLVDRLEPQRAGGWMQPATETTLDAGVPLSLSGLRMELGSTDPGSAIALDWLAVNRKWLGPLLIVILILPAIAVRRHHADAGLGPTPPMVLAGYAGFTCLAAEVVLAWRLQTLTGELYWLVALLTAVVLGGLFLGTLLATSRSLTMRIYSTIIAMLMLAAATLAWLGSYHPAVIAGIWLLAVLIPLATGVALGRVLRDPTTAPWRLYTADLAGSAIAALATTIGLLCWGAGWCALALAPVWVVLAMRSSNKH